MKNFPVKVKSKLIFNPFFDSLPAAADCVPSSSFHRVYYSRIHKILISDWEFKVKPVLIRSKLHCYFFVSYLL